MCLARVVRATRSDSESGRPSVVFSAPNQHRAGARPSGRFNRRTFLALRQYRNVTGIAPHGSGVNAALRSFAQRPR